MFNISSYNGIAILGSKNDLNSQIIANNDLVIYKISNKKYFIFKDNKAYFKSRYITLSNSLVAKALLTNNTIISKKEIEAYGKRIYREE